MSWGAHYIFTEWGGGGQEHTREAVGKDNWRSETMCVFWEGNRFHVAGEQGAGGRKKKPAWANCSQAYARHFQMSPHLVLSAVLEVASIATILPRVPRPKTFSPSSCSAEGEVERMADSRWGEVAHQVTSPHSTLEALGWKSCENSEQGMTGSPLTFRKTTLLVMEELNRVFFSLLHSVKNN